MVRQTVEIDIRIRSLFKAGRIRVLKGGALRREGDGRLALEGGARSVAGMTIGQGCNQGETSPFLN